MPLSATLCHSDETRPGPSNQSSADPSVGFPFPRGCGASENPGTRSSWINHNQTDGIRDSKGILSLTLERRSRRATVHGTPFARVRRTQSSPSSMRSLKPSRRSATQETVLWVRTRSKELRKQDVVRRERRTRTTPSDSSGFGKSSARSTIGVAIR